MTALLWKYVAAAVGSIAAVLAVFFFGYHQGGLSARLVANTAHSAELIAIAKDYQARELAHQTKEAAYAKELTGLQNVRAATPDPVVRMCPSATHIAVSAPGSRGQELPTAPGLGASAHDDVPQPDYGPFLFAFADRYDALVAKCRAD